MINDRVFGDNTRGKRKKYKVFNAWLISKHTVNIELLCVYERALIEDICTIMYACP